MPASPPLGGRKRRKRSGAALSRRPRRPACSSRRASFRSSGGHEPNVDRSHDPHHHLAASLSSPTCGPLKTISSPRTKTTRPPAPRRRNWATEVDHDASSFNGRRTARWKAATMRLRRFSNAGGHSGNPTSDRGPNPCQYKREGLHLACRSLDNFSRRGRSPLRDFPTKPQREFARGKPERCSANSRQTKGEPGTKFEPRPLPAPPK